jgi:hypothetical protein
LVCKKDYPLGRLFAAIFAWGLISLLIGNWLFDVLSSTFADIWMIFRAAQTSVLGRVPKFAPPTLGPVLHDLARQAGQVT